MAWCYSKIDEIIVYYDILSLRNLLLICTIILEYDDINIFEGVLFNLEFYLFYCAILIKINK